MLKFIIGALCGAGIALLVAPQTGAATRSMIRDKATALGNDLGDLAESKGRNMANKMQGYKHRIRKVAENMRGNAERTMAGVGGDTI